MSFKINYNSYKTLVYNSRVRFLVLHYTALNFEDSINVLTKDNNVSSHYLMPDPDDKTYPLKDVEIISLVSEEQRAWHAGVSSWKNRTNINDTSIGIEIVNQPYPDIKTKELIFPDFNKTQIQSLIQLCQNILQRYPDIEPTNIIGHSDIACGRKIDPGPKFPWKELYDNAIGAWYDDKLKQSYINKFTTNFPKLEEIQEKFLKYGYKINITNVMDQNTTDVTTCFQMHFRNSNYDGKLDVETVATLWALSDKYDKNIIT